MSAEKKDRRQLQALRPGGGHGHFRRAPVEKAKDFKGTLKRLLMFLKPHRFKLYTVIVLSVLSTAFSIMSPKIMGKVTTELFEGVLAKHKGIPGAGIDFSYIANILFVLVALYLISAVFNYLQQYIMVDVAQNTVFQMRSEINDKLSKLPLKFFDSHTHGEILSRVTNDVDTISSSLGESFSQVITAIVMLVGIIVMMLTISPVMTLMVCFVVIPLSFIVTKYVTSRSQKYFVQQQRVLGELNGHVEEMYTGHQIVKAFGMEENSINKFNQLNEDLYDSGWKAQFMSGVIMPLMNLINNMGYMVVCVIGGIYVMKRVITIGDMEFRSNG
jgi:ATP-binding cassette subfamily B multidrug efflux pump